METQKFFFHFSEEIKIQLRNMMRLRTLDTGEAIFYQGEPADAIYVVLSGRVKITRVTPDGYESILCVRQPGGYFCPVPVLDEKSHLGTAVAISPARILVAERESFLALCRQYPELLAFVQGDCLAEVRHLLNRLETYAFRRVKERLAIALLNEAHRLYAGQEGSLVLPVKQQELAGLIGASRESVSRNLVQLEQAGIIQLHRGKIHILDFGELQRIADPDRL